MTKNWKWWHWLLLVLVVTAGIILFVVTLGKIDLNAGSDEKLSTTEKKRLAKERIKQYEIELAKDQALKQKLDKRVTRIFAGTRVLLVGLWGSVMCVFWNAGFIHNISDFLTYTEATLLAVVTINFITFGSITSVESFIEWVKNRIAIKVYKHNVMLPEVIENKQKEMKELEAIV
jgi:hypothetical protein